MFHPALGPDRVAGPPCPGSSDSILAWATLISLEQPVGAQLVNGVRMSTDLSRFGHLSRPLTMARPASFGRWRHVNRFPSLGSPRTPTYTPTPTTLGGTRRHENYHSRVVIRIRTTPSDTRQHVNRRS
jgi:hypothetical protein